MIAPVEIRDDIQVVWPNAYDVAIYYVGTNPEAPAQIRTSLVGRLVRVIQIDLTSRRTFYVHRSRGRELMNVHPPSEYL